MPYHIHRAIPSSMCSPIHRFNKYSSCQKQHHIRWWPWTELLLRISVNVRWSLLGYRNEQSNSLCQKHYVVITTFHPLLKREFANNITDVETCVSTVNHFHIYAVDPLIQLKLGMRNGQASNANKIKVLTGHCCLPLSSWLYLATLQRQIVASIMTIQDECWYPQSTSRTTTMTLSGG